MIRSGCSPALNYGEAQEAESRKDFIHKMGICRKELRETKIALKIIVRKPYKEVCNYSPHKKSFTNLMRIISRKDTMLAKF